MSHPAQINPGQTKQPGSDAAKADAPSTTVGHGVDPDIAALLREASNGDEASWSELVARYADRVFALARSRCRDPELAEEITQSVFVTVATKLATGGYSEQGRFESWLFRVAMNRIRDEKRRVKRHATPTAPGDMASIGAREAEERADLAPLRRAMSALTDADREIVELRHHAGLSFKEIADLLDEPMGTLLARHHRALKKLKRMIEEGSTES